MVTELLSASDRQRARQLIEAAGLRFEDDFDNLMGVFEGRELAGVGARCGNVFKMLVVAPDFQDGPTLGALITELMRAAGHAGHDAFFIFTRPQYATSFQALNFTPLVQHPQTTLLEFGDGLRHYLNGHAALVAPGENGALVMNCNPFTRGHRYVIEHAARQVDTLYIFVVREDRSAFPFAVRKRLVEEGTAHLRNVRVLDSSCYAVSSLTFPAYFLKDAEEAGHVQMEVDALLFARSLAPFFHIRKRFVGSEPYCRTTRCYNESLKRLLPTQGIAVVEIERVMISEDAVSAYRVREALRNEAYETVRQMVPATTFRYLMSDEAQFLRDKLKNYQRRH
ncbi:[citrate (pro-3S)-lyase] ligase [Geoalkalibacter ferrihydriticus]|uniref:Citrate lyase ligase n=2 Tax=Geoalkalibacter ferrihydriticus TaxID=392333 RepID=A0A0C2HL84_9BACT|nr:citrate lyase ligase [Geoalkalibacter ferrihydriticus]KIH75745.1 citrate lyase ligase [Geoalkalibacter ferrihydriticus DSM 17813]SDM63093.1 [citrate (pro-3S)-lyase] ligase [Geoalkalibacter ferrihydriticus]